MKKIAVIYKSTTGFTEKYAKWIAEDLPAELFEVKKVNIELLKNYDIIIYGGGLYAGGVNGISFITKNFESIKDKELYLFTVGAADVTNKENTTNIKASLAKVLTEQMQDKIKIFHLRGGLDYKNMGAINRIMMSFMIKLIKKKPEQERSNDDKELIKTYGQTIDFTNRDSILNIVSSIKSSM